MESTSLTLLDRLRQERHQNDWSRFVELYEPFIRRFIRLDPSLASDADDICQEVMRKVVEHVPTFERIRHGSFRCWLKTITVNEVNYFWRRRNRGAQFNRDRSHSLIDSLADPTNALSQAWDQEHGAHVLQGLQRLIEGEFTPTTWRAFEMRVLEEKSTAQVADLLGISRNAVDIAKSRVLARLRQESVEFLD